MNEIERTDSEILEPDEVIYTGLADASTIEAAAWPLKDARFRIAEFAARYPGYQDELIRILGHIDVAEGIMKSLEYKTYGDYGHTA